MQEVQSQTQIILDGKSLTPEKLNQLSKKETKVALAESCWQKIREARKVITDIVEEKRVVYGVNTGFGNFANTIISKEQTVELQKNLIRSHAAGVGQPLSLELTRMLLALRINVLAKGFSGISPESLERYIDGYNKDILPFIPEKGTVGASGDLAPLSHLALGMMGEGKVWDEENNKWNDAKIVQDRLGFTPISLKEKEGLALINGTQFMTAIGAQTICRAKILTKSADIIAAMTSETQFGERDIIMDRVHQLRGQKGQIEVAKRMAGVLLENDKQSELNIQLHKKHQKEKGKQDAYAILCIPQVHGVTHDTIEFVDQMLTEELNSATDNPLVFTTKDGFKKDITVSGGNFHGEYSSKALDYMTIAVHEIGSISERRIERLVNPNLSYLPDFLVNEGGLNNGFMIAHCTAAALVSENKTLSHPASIDTITTSANQEDHVSMGGWSSRKCKEVVTNVEYVLAIELMATCQALELLKPLKSTTKVQKIFEEVRKIVPYMEKDYVFTEHIENLAKFIQSGKILEIVGETY